MANGKTMSNVRPRQVLLVGLGGVGSRTVDTIMGIMPAKYKKYTKAIVVDTDVGELSERIKNIPSDHRIPLGSNPDNGDSVFVGEYISNNPETMQWFVKGGHLQTIESRNTRDGAKQIRMVSRIALAATNQFCNMQKTLEDILQDLNAADGTTIGGGLLVMVICSVAGGTGAGTVLQFPLYLEQALSKNFSDEDVQMECSMLLPNMFSRAQDPENYEAAKANAYAVIRELMALNSGRLKRADILPECDFGAKSEHISPYGRVLLFDDVSMSGDSIEQDLDSVYVPKTAKAISEYLFGAASGKITSALDNTLARVYRTNGAAIFSSVGSANLTFPRVAYTQYVTAKWIDKVISDTWTFPDKDVQENYRKLMRNAIQNSTAKPTEQTKRTLYRSVVDKQATVMPFFKEIKQAYKETLGDQDVTLAQLFWQKAQLALQQRVVTDPAVRVAKEKFAMEVRDSADTVEMNSALDRYIKALETVMPYGVQFENDTVCPVQIENPEFYSKDQDETHLYTFIKSKKIHPIMIRYFLYEIYDMVCMFEKNAELNLRDTSVIPQGKVKTSVYREAIGKAATKSESRAKSKIVSIFARELKKDLEVYIEEAEGMFKSLEYVLTFFNELAKRTLNGLVPSNPKNGNVLAGGPLSMKYVWKRIESQISESEDSFTIDPELNNVLHQILYKGFVEQLNGVNDASLDGETIKVRTKYETIVSSYLQKYYSKVVHDRYSMVLPKNVLEAALLECGLQNQYADNLSRADEPEKYTKDYFIARGGRPANYEDGEETPEGAATDAEYLTALISGAIANSKPYCGRVYNGAGEGGILNRLVVANERILRKQIDMDHVSEDGVAGEKYIEDEFIPGVSTSHVGNFDINKKFVSDGISTDEILFVTTLAGLQPFNFVAFLPEDDDEHAPNDGESYYNSYREHIENVAINTAYITPHLHRDWHYADKLEDVTAKHTSAYNKEAATAFVYGFVFDVIRVDSEGVVRIGKSFDKHFTALDSTGVKELKLLDESFLAKVAEQTGKEKRDSFNAILVKLFELLATSELLRDTIISYAEHRLEELRLEKSANFIRYCLADRVFDGTSIEKENIEEFAEERYAEDVYDNILDVCDGYYQGTQVLKYNEPDRARKNVGFMFVLLTTQIFEMCKMFVSEPSEIKQLYLGMIAKLYNDAKCDDPIDAAAKASIIAAADDIDAYIYSVQKTDKTTAAKLFAEGQVYSQQSAENRVEHYLAQ